MFLIISLEIELLYNFLDAVNMKHLGSFLDYS